MYSLKLIYGFGKAALAGAGVNDFRLVGARTCRCNTGSLSLS